MSAAAGAARTWPWEDDPDGWAAEIAEIDADEQAIVEYMAELRDTPADERHATLSAWARSDLWHPAMMLLMEWQGELAREAYCARKRDLAADTPARRWAMIDPAIGRASIIRLLGLEGDPVAYYAAAAFRTWLDDDGRNWIAGAIGAAPFVTADAAMRWTHLDIRDVVLWDPRTNELRIAGEHTSVSMFVMPDLPDERLVIRSDGAAFFRAWAERRATVGRLCREQSVGKCAHPIIEPADGGLPGGLLVGNYLQAPWPDVRASTVLAGEGLTAAELHFAAVRAARLPQFGAA